MAKGKKSKGTHYTSKGERVSTRKDISKALKREKHPVDAMVAKINAWKAGKKVNLLVANPTAGTNKPFIKVDAKEVWGDPRNFYAMNKRNANTEETA